jgi:hypothetical protein
MSYVQRRRFLWAVFLIGLALVAAAANATTLVHLSLPQMVRQSTAIVRAHCENTHVRLDRGEIWTDTTFQVLETHKGLLPGRIVVRQPGGVLNHLHSRVDESPVFHPGEEVILFLWGGGTKPFSVLGWSQGTFRIHGSVVTGGETVTQDSASAPVLDPATGDFAKAGYRNVPIEVFEAALRREISRHP